MQRNINRVACGGLIVAALVAAIAIAASAKRTSHTDATTSAARPVPTATVSAARPMPASQPNLTVDHRDRNPLSVAQEIT